MFRATAPTIQNDAGVRGVSYNAGAGAGVASGKYPFRLNFYNSPPNTEITIEEFETFAIDRLRLLALIESSQIRNLPWAQLSALYATTAKKYMPLSSSSAKNIDLEAERLKDHQSHFILRLAFAGSDDLRKRFLQAEKTLFKLRFESDSPSERQQFLSSLNLSWQPLTPQEKGEIIVDLMNVASAGGQFKQKQPSAGDEVYYKVPWTQVPDLVQSRRVLLRKGFAYVSAKDQFSLLSQAFAESLTKGLEMTAKALPRLDESTRLLPILSNLSLSFLSGGQGGGEFDSESSGELVTANQVAQLAKEHFPPCSRHLWEVGTQDKHLKHFGRLQLGLFLKGIGMSIEEAVIWWRKMFDVGGKMSEDKFKKEYLYNIRHSYGLEGTRKNYPAPSCQRILTSSQPGPQDNHGCPFRHFGPERLQSFLTTTYKLGSSDIPEIMHSVKGGHYHVACTRVFELTHSGGEFGVKKGEGIGGGESVSHPNKYYERSREIQRAREGAAPAIEMSID